MNGPISIARLSSVVSLILLVTVFVLQTGCRTLSPKQNNNTAENQCSHCAHYQPDFHAGAKRSSTFDQVHERQSFDPGRQGKQLRVQSPADDVPVIHASRYSEDRANRIEQNRTANSQPIEPTNEAAAPAAILDSKKTEQTTGNVKPIQVQPRPQPQQDANKRAPQKIESSDQPTGAANLKQRINPAKNTPQAVPKPEMHQLKIGAEPITSTDETGSTDSESNQSNLNKPSSLPTVSGGLTGQTANPDGSVTNHYARSERPMIQDLPQDDLAHQSTSLQSHRIIKNHFYRPQKADIQSDPRISAEPIRKPEMDSLTTVDPRPVSISEPTSKPDQQESKIAESPIRLTARPTASLQQPDFAEPSEAQPSSNRKSKPSHKEANAVRAETDAPFETPRKTSTVTNPSRSKSILLKATWKRAVNEPCEKSEAKLQQPTPVNRDQPQTDPPSSPTHCDKETEKSRQAKTKSIEPTRLAANSKPQSGITGKPQNGELRSVLVSTSSISQAGPQSEMGPKLASKPAVPRLKAVARAAKPQSNSATANRQPEQTIDREATETSQPQRSSTRVEAGKSIDRPVPTWIVPPGQMNPAISPMLENDR